ncbi:hypothetical protein B5E42_07630 [Flavonifractor sp. An10]|nr:hypothetical protein B5E42_07630 [Flavonifractor sp. An10]
METSFQDLKYTLALTHFHAKKRPFIEQEIFAKMTLYNFAALLRLHAVLRNRGQASLPLQRRFCHALFLVAYIC